MSDIVIPDKLADLGITPPSWEWRAAQQDLASQIANSPKKIILLEAECGSGKSVIPLAAAKSAGKNALVLIRTIQLQQQYLGDIRGLTMLTGRGRYICDITHNSAEYAPCTIGTRCELKGQWSKGQPLTIPECTYFRQKAAAITSQFSVLNYAYWLREIKSDISSFGQRDWIICDEAHEIEQVLMDAGVIELDKRTIKEYVESIPRSKDITVWLAWAADQYPTVHKQFNHIKSLCIDAGLIESRDEMPTKPLDPASPEAQELSDRFRELKKLDDALTEMKEIDSPDTWVYDSDPNHHFIEPIFGAPAFKKLLACATDKVIMMSAFLAPQALIRNLGLDPDDVEVITAPEVFNRKNSPIFYLPTVKMSYHTRDNEWRYIAHIIDEIANMPAYANKKGIIHVPSVALRDRLAKIMPHRTQARLAMYDGGDTHSPYRRFPPKDDVLEIFKKSDKPLILLGQSVSTGVDLPHVPQWQIIVKMSFPPLTSPALAKRHETDKNFMPYLTLCELVQAAGRIKRAEDHDGPTFILDEQFGWFEPRMRQHMPPWFRKALVKKGWDRWGYLREKRSRLAFQNGVLLA